VRAVRNLRLSVRALAVHRVRTGLAVAGTAVGVAGVLVLTAVGDGARIRVLGELESLGGDALIITPAPVDGRTRLLRRGSATGRSLLPGDAASLESGSLAIHRAVPIVDGTRLVRNGTVRDAITIVGTTAAWQAARRFDLVAGRFFTASENERRERVAVLGMDARTRLFADTTDPIGRTIRIGKVPFTVTGVLGAKGMSASGTATEDDRIVIPLETAMRRVLSVDRPKMIVVEAVSSRALDEAAAEAAAILRVLHGIPAGEKDDFVIQSQRALLEARLDSEASFRRLLAGLGLLSLLVAGIGILSVMLLSVRERRGEIGLRVAVGGRRSDLIVQFLAEALWLAGGGLLVGIPVGAAAAVITSAMTAWDARVSAGTIVVTVVAALVTGAGAGVLPAWRAACLDPVDALRSD
jgi:putative ABC transport system permease protein